MDAELIAPVNSRPIRLRTVSNMERLVDYDFIEKSILRLWNMERLVDYDLLKNLY